MLTNNSRRSWLLLRTRGSNGWPSDLEMYKEIKRFHALQQIIVLLFHL